MSKWRRMPSADQRGDALPVGRDLVQAVAVGVDADRLDPFGREGGEVARLDRAAVRPRMRRGRGGDLATVECRAARRGDRLESACRRRKGEALADLGRAAVRQERVGPARQRAEQRRRGDPLLLDDDRDRIAALGDFDRRREQVGEGQGPEALESATQAATAPGTVTESQPRTGGRVASPCFLRKYWGVHAAGAGPEAFRPCSLLPSQRMQNASSRGRCCTARRSSSPPPPAIAPSTALPPCWIMRSPAWAASGCEVETMLRAKTGTRVDG
jgi:hypothetical protein